VVVGSTCSGKSTLAQRLAALHGVPFVELDALYWKPGWVGSSDDEFFARIAEATGGDAWVIAGSYTRSRHLTWPRVQAVVWLDLPLALIVWRVLRRSWRRWLRSEVLWGTNAERFWPQLAIWRKEDSLVWWAFHTHRPNRSRLLADMTDPTWAHIRFIRLCSRSEIQEFVRSIERAVGTATR
jgi:adenylate kinase family enzyme